ncbi:putative imidazole glycerol phosphate synthase subunit hisF2 [Spirochaetia bacterium]|nr:putative imidazole glycerol phosphate synthase subunit hisF2 [Spirochaetia bacterium]
MRKRLIPCIFLKNGLIIRSESFKTHQIVGNAIEEIARYNEWAVDEIIYIDISTEEKYDLRRDDLKVKDIIKTKYDLVKEIARVCFVPLGFGGGIRTIEDIKNILSSGADKVVLNTILFLDDNFSVRAAEIFGNQALVACVDYRDDGFVYHTHGTINSNIKVLEWCRHLESKRIGEIFLNNIDRDGKATGFDTETIKLVVDNTNLPIIGLAGAGDYFDFVDCFQEANPSAAAAGNIFHFKEHSYYYAKQTLLKSGIDVRNA